MRCFCLLSVVAVLGCSGGLEPDNGPPVQLAALPRELTADELRFSRAANEFALDLFQRLNCAQPATNVFVSPLSASFALGMTMNGANGRTLDEMRSVLGFGSSTLEEINRGYRGLIDLEQALDPSTTFGIANSVWYRSIFPFEQVFLSEVRSTFDAEVRPSTFDAGTVKAVNDWVRAKTNARIPEIVKSIDPLSVMLLINAIYFKGSWRDQFDPAKTALAPFAAIGGTQQVQMMSRSDDEGTARSGRLTGATVGELVYGNSAFVMTIIVPDEDVDAFAATLDSTRWRAAVQSLGVEWPVPVRLPKFKLEYERTLNDDLQALGMHDAFIGGVADFTPMSPKGLELYISTVLQKTFVDVNEEGTEAAAVTAVDVFTLDNSSTCVCVTKPFVFAIRERFSGTILFIGKIVRIPD